MQINGRPPFRRLHPRRALGAARALLGLLAAGELKAAHTLLGPLALAPAACALVARASSEKIHWNPSLCMPSGEILV